MFPEKKLKKSTGVNSVNLFNLTQIKNISLPNLILILTSHNKLIATFFLLAKIVTFFTEFITNQDSVTGNKKNDLTFTI